MTHEEYIQEIVRITDSVKAFGKGYYRRNYDEDCVQEAVYVCLKRYRDYDGTCSVLTWMTRIYINLQKQVRWRKNHFDLSGVIPETTVEPVYGYYDYKYILSKIDKMKPYQKNAIIRLMNGLKVRETAAILNYNANSVKMNNCKARTELRRLINDKSLLENHMPNERCAHHKQNIDPAA